MAVQVVGVELSTFTRTVRMALEYLEVPYELVRTAPHSTVAYKHNPFGRIPTLIHDELIVNETLAIRIYIDHTFGSAARTLTPPDLPAILAIGQWISMASDYAFRGLVHGICKPRQAMEAKGANEQEIQEKLKDAVTQGQEILRGLESQFIRLGSGGQTFLAGESLTWADLFLFPIFSDLCAMPERALVQKEAPKLYAWYERFVSMDIARITHDGTVAAARL
ncbi:hypothetical protein FBU59_003715 [Linderina macrospora]|uniref:Uncharacterized protein n=1 Tax=Linderina macrospora TaxID=4868 RepID=A0ACC1J7G0_9FUNG|nr:hypothetical protein FBU59_003715 [Linderina macrospora]